MTSPAVADGTVFVGSWDGVLYALDAESGVRKWAFQAGLDPVVHNQVGFQSSPALVDGTVCVGCRDAHVYALDAATGQRKWDYPTSKSRVNGTPAVQDPMKILNPDGSLNHDAFAPVFGDFQDMYIDFYRYTSIGAIVSSPVVDQGVVCVGSTDGYLYALN